MNITTWLIPVVAFIAVFMASLGIVAYATGANQRRLQQRLKNIHQVVSEDAARSMLREQYLHDLSALELWLENLPGMSHIERLSEQAGRHQPAYRLVLMSFAAAIVACLVLLILGRPLLALLAFSIVLPLPYMKLTAARNARIALFEEQLADALDIISRALRAGNPFTETLKVVSQEMPDPIATEFGITFSDISFGVSVKSAFLGLLDRVPNISLTAMVTAVLVQRETGGNTADILAKVAQILRQRHRFKRRLRTLTAEGRMSAWVLILMPFVLSLVISIVSPGYLLNLIHDPFGVQLVLSALGLMGVGVLWIRHIIRVRF